RHRAARQARARAAGARRARAVALPAARAAPHRADDAGADHAGRAGGGRSRRGAARPMTTLLAATQHIKGPHIDYAALSPVLAPLGGALIVLLVSLFPGRFVQRALVPFLTVA